MLARLSAKLSGRPSSPFFASLRDSRPLAKRYLIATTGRAGSHFLCSRIADHANLGFPMEFFNESYISQFEALFPSPNLADFEAYVGANFASPEGVFGLKTDWWRFGVARNLGILQSLVSPPDLVAYLYREDFVAQAVSQTLAVATQIWHSRDVSTHPIADLHAALTYEAAAIEENCRSMLNQEYLWLQFIEQSGAPSLQLAYEDISRDPDPAVAAIAQILGVPLDRDPPPSDAVTRQGTPTAQLWAQRFREDRPDFVAFWSDYRGLVVAA
ncbi:Stf0 family sulfotransferase [Phenylobacterium sp.]|uniref:Stf0 family sulfotransferase n=1 Tax=Phenylobacterium sp. TaxID=1871053 RepID=UPI0039834895